MSKKIAPIIFSGILLFGLVIAIVGYAMGGRLGNVGIEDGRFVYHESGQSLQLGDAPGWLSRLRTGRYISSRSGHLSSAEHPEKPERPLVAAQSVMQQLDVNISAGYLVIRPGQELGLSVDGTMPYDMDFSNGAWSLSATTGNNITTQTIDGKTHFFSGGRDITTTFYLTVPTNFSHLEVDIAMGEADISDLTVAYMDCTTSLGAIVVRDCVAEGSEFTAELGSIDLNNFTGVSCELNCELGAISLNGEITQYLTANCDMGSIKGKLARPADYGWEARAELGSVRLDHMTTSGLDSHSEHNHSAHTFFDLRTGMGSIDITFVA